jgi:ribosome-binding factor A
MKRDRRGGRGSDAGPSQRQLRAGELIRHALVDILREGDLHDEALENASITVTEVRMSPDLKHATCFVEPLGAGLQPSGHGSGEVVQALNRSARFLRGKLGRHIDMRFTPDLRFVHDESFDEAQRMNALFNRPEVRRDLEHEDDAEGEAGSPPAKGG